MSPSIAERFADLREDINDEASEAEPVGLLAQRVLLGELIANGLPPVTYLDTPTFGAEPLFYREGVFMISGPRKHGKTHTATFTIKDRINAGLPSLYLDFENGKRIIGQRLKDTGLKPTAIDEHLIYVPFPQGVELSTFRASLEQVSDQYPDLLLIIDSWRGLGSRLGVGIPGFNPKVDDHIERAFAPITEIVKTRGLPCIVLDHPTKATTADSDYVTANSQAKEAVADVIYYVQKEEDYSVYQRGALSITVKHDREGRLSLDPRMFRIGGQGDDGRVRLEPAAEHEIGKLREISEAIKDWLADNAGDVSTAKTQTAVEKAVEGRAAAIRAQLKRLANDPREPVQTVDVNGSTKYYAAEPMPAGAEPEL